MTLRRLQQIHDVTDNFFFWQGLRWVPLGIVMLAWGFALSPGVRIPEPVRNWVGLPVLAIAFWISSSVLGRYYASRFGRVRGDPDRHTTRTSISWFVVYPAIAIAFVIDAAWAPPILLSAIALGLAVEAYRESTGGGRRHYIVAALALAAFAALPAFGILPVGRPALAPLIGLVGVVYVVGGLLDHRELVRILGASSESENASPV